ncbi:MAG: DNA repair protein RecO [Patescibacteria group bacterium]|nr:DNA repair protein RecO [Patescibacteria group bacterium]
MIKTRAIVLGKKDYREYDALVSFYSLDFGRINLLARGLKRESSKLAGHLEPFNLVDLMIIKGREKDYVGSAISENYFLNIKNNYSRAVLAGRALGFMKDLTYLQQADFNIFLLVRDFLIFLDSLSDDKELDLISYFFKLKLLELLGYNFSSIDNLDKESDLQNNFASINQETLDLKNKILRLGFSGYSQLSLKEGEKRDLDKFIEIIRGIIF